MLNLKRAAILLFAAAAAMAQPALTTIQDILYKADGTRFTGTVFITWDSFQAGGGANVATSNLTLSIVNGVLRVQLVPTTTASGGAQYSVRYNSRGINQFSETWAVPPSSVTLRVRDVRISTGTVVGPPPVVSPVQIPDVVGLSNELALRPMKGVGFGIGRAAVINQAGQLDAAAGNPGDCVRVDGSAGVCGGGAGIAPVFSDGEVPSGLINGSNLTFSLAHAPSPASSLNLYRNGLLLKAGSDYVLSSNTITFFVASAPQSGDLLLAGYRFADPNNPLSSLGSPEVICSSPGASTTLATSVSLGTCTIPAALLGTGDRLGIEFHYQHTGTLSGFTGEVRVGGTSVALRSPPAAETVLAGRSGFSVFPGAEVWNAETWGASSTLTTSAGTASEDPAQAIVIDFRGQLATGGGDSLVLRNLTVIRYPAQTSP